MSNINAVGIPTDAPISTPQTAKKQEFVSQDSFLQLLVAQIKNQDPLNPADGTQFLSQLAQFSELEQLVGIRTIMQQTAVANTSETTA